MPTLADIIQVAILQIQTGIPLYLVPEEQTQYPYLYWEFHETGRKAGGPEWEMESG